MHCQLIWWSDPAILSLTAKIKFCVIKNVSLITVVGGLVGYLGVSYTVKKVVAINPWLLKSGLDGSSAVLAAVILAASSAWTAPIFVLGYI